MVYYVFLMALFLLISVLAKRLAGKSVSDMTYIVSSGTLNLNSINQSKTLFLATLLASTEKTKPNTLKSNKYKTQTEAKNGKQT